MHTKITRRAFCSMLLALPFPAQAQQPKKVPRLGYLSSGDAAFESTRSEGVRLALRERGYIEGQSIAIEYRYAEGKRDRLPELAAELVRLMDSSFLTMTLSIGRMGQGRHHRGSRRDLGYPCGQECDQDDSHRYGGPFGRSCRDRPN